MQSYGTVRSLVQQQNSWCSNPQAAMPNKEQQSAYVHCTKSSSKGSSRSYSAALHTSELALSASVLEYKSYMLLLRASVQMR
eukprot:3574-Heterococcus_DN1.PRE.2